MELKLRSALRRNSLRQQTEGILSVHLAQNLVGQIDTVDLPTALPRCMGRIVKVLIGCFQKPEIEPVHGFFRYQVGAKQDAILEPVEQGASGIGLPPEFRGPCADVEENIGMVLQ